jgi:cytochrome c
MSRTHTAVAVSIVTFAASLLFARSHPFGDAGLYAQSRNGTILQSTDIPPKVRETLMTKCADCHSTQTRPPVYGRLAPVSWLMERDIVEARKAMNLSQWDNYSAEDREAFKVKIFLEVKSRRMPLPQYRILHWNARITDPDLDLLGKWARQSGLPVASQVMAVVSDGDDARGKDVFQRRCTGCHSLEQNREGPRLRGVFGRVSGSIADFDYTPAIKQAHIQWNEVTLERWLADPDVLVPGNNMEFHVAKPQERKDLVQFLKESGDQ